MPNKSRLGEYLLHANAISRLQLDYALQKQQVTQERLGEILIRLGVASESLIAQTLARHRGISYHDSSDDLAIDAEVLTQFSYDLCSRQAFLPLRRVENTLVVLLGNADLGLVQKTVHRACGLEVKALQADFSVALQYIKTAYRKEQIHIEDALRKEIDKLTADVEQVLSNDDLLSYILMLAATERATDVHLQPDAKSIHISFRVDGVLRPVLALHKSFRRLVLSIKVRSGMDISDNLRPQDGRFTLQLQQMQYDIRVSTTITRNGENVVMRLLPSGSHVKTFLELGFLEEDLEKLNYFFAQPYGIVLFAGPTGSGKTTSMFAGIKKQALSGKNILSIEDPVEYEIPVVVQTQVNRKAEFLFDKAIIHFLRHDPDVILVGEIRDTETALAAIQAAETGHLVLSTLHVNSAFGVLPRLNGLGIKSRSIAGALIGVINQRLVRVLCPQCRQIEDQALAVPHWLGEFEGIELFQAVGCAHCRWTGYYGRVPIYEILLVDNDFADTIITEGSLRELTQAAQQSGYISMEEVARKRLLRGETTVAELLRVMGHRTWR